MACSPNPNIICTPPLASTSHMVSREHVQEGIATKHMQHPQNTQYQVIHAAKLKVLAPFTP